MVLFSNLLRVFPQLSKLFVEVFLLVAVADASLDGKYPKTAFFNQNFLYSHC